jgi:hypothetical protein
MTKLGIYSTENVISLLIQRYTLKKIIKNSHVNTGKCGIFVESNAYIYSETNNY